MKNRTKVLVAVAVVLGLSSVAVAGTQAYWGNSNGTGPTAIISAIAKKFNLKEADVQNVFNEQRQAQQTERQAQMQQAFADRIAGAVANGKLTQAQANLINAKHKELQVFRDTLNNKTPAERQAAMKTQQETLKKWMTDNNIPQSYMFFAGGMGMKGGRGGHGMGMGRGF